MKKFLYILLRDHLPAGVVEEIMVSIRPAASIPADYSNAGLAQYADELARELEKFV